MDWMYKGVSGLVDKEEYLTGRRIDKTFEVIETAENPSAKGDLDAFVPSIPGSILESGHSAQSMVTIDLAAKLREDPLYEIRVKQREERKKLLHNPLKMKKLKNLLESTLRDDLKHKRDKKKKKRRHSSSSSSSNSSDSESDHRNDRNSDRRHSHRSDHKRRHSSERRNHRNRDSSRDRDGNRHRERRDERKYNQILKKVKNDDSRIPKRYDNKNANESKPKKLSEEEMEKKRQEMLNNAVWRECQRKSNVKSYQEEEQKESQFNSTGKSAQFIKPLLKSATEIDSIEERIRQKRFRSQRGHDTMDKNFARR